MQHSVIPPSSAGQWVYCFGWPTIAHACPDETQGEAAAEGTASHWIIPQGVKVVSQGDSPSQMKKLKTKLIGNPAENGVIVTDEMWDCAMVAVDHIRNLMLQYRHSNPHLEQRIDASQFVHPSSFGTVDCWFYSKQQNTLFILDYKYGHGIVEAFENWQGINYFAGIIADEEIRLVKPDVVITIIQPRARHKDGIIRHWNTSVEELQPYVTQLSNAANAALSHDTTCTVGTHCHHCKARSRCPAMGRATGHALDYVGLPIPSELDGHELGLQLDHLKRAQDIIEYRISGLEQQAEAMDGRGEYVQGYALRDYYGNNTWMGKPDEVIKRADELGVDVRKPGVITPPQAIKAGLDKEVVKDMTHKPRRGTRLEKVTDNDARRIFGRGKGE